MAWNFETDQDRRADNTSMEISNLFLLLDCKHLKLTTLFNPNMSLKPLNSENYKNVVTYRFMNLSFFFIKPQLNSEFMCKMKLLRFN